MGLETKLILHKNAHNRDYKTRDFTMDHRWRPIVDESALNSMAGSRLGSEVGGRAPTRGGLTRTRFSFSVKIFN